MGSTASALGSTSSTGGATPTTLSALVQPVTLNGVSQYSSDFQSILSRQVSIADLPLQALETEQSNEQQERATLISLNSTVANLGNSLAALGQLGQSQALAANSSDSSVVTAQTTGTATGATSYTISNVSFLASAASETSVSGYADGSTAAVSATGNLTLVVGSQSIPITLTSGQNNLQGLVSAINNLNAGVTATVLTTGTGANPNYLSLTATATGATTLQLNDTQSNGSSVDLLTQSNQGTDAQFDLNNLPVTSASNTIANVAPGVIFTLTGTTSANQTVNVTLSPDASQLSSALQNLATNYNALVDQVDQQTGTGAGLLGGDFIIRQVEQALNSVSFYQGSGSSSSGSSILGLANLGVSIDETGQMSFDPTALSGLTPGQVTEAFQFLGSTTTGFGALAQNFDEISNPDNGLIQLQENGLDSQDSSLSNQISALTAHINTMQSNLQLQLAAADSAVAELQSQQTVIAASVQSVDLALYGYGYGSGSAQTS